jgi:hypothetical protein
MRASRVEVGVRGQQLVVDLRGGVRGRRGLRLLEAILRRAVEVELPVVLLVRPGAAAFARARPDAALVGEGRRAVVGWQVVCGFRGLLIRQCALRHAVDHLGLRARGALDEEGVLAARAAHADPLVGNPLVVQLELGRAPLAGDDHATVLPS